MGNEQHNGPKYLLLNGEAAQAFASVQEVGSNKLYLLRESVLPSQADLVDQAQQYNPFLLLPRHEHCLRLLAARDSSERSFCSQLFKLHLVYEHASHSLREEIEHRCSRRQQFTEKELVVLASHLTNALSFLGVHGIAHNRLSADSVLLTVEGKVKLLDPLSSAKVNPPQQPTGTELLKLGLVLLSAALLQHSTSKFHDGEGRLLTKRVQQSVSTVSSRFPEFGALVQKCLLYQQGRRGMQLMERGCSGLEKKYAVHQSSAISLRLKPFKQQHQSRQQAVEPRPPNLSNSIKLPTQKPLPPVGLPSLFDQVPKQSQAKNPPMPQIKSFLQKHRNGKAPQQQGDKQVAAVFHHRHPEFNQCRSPIQSLKSTLEPATVTVPRQQPNQIKIQSWPQQPIMKTTGTCQPIQFQQRFNPAQHFPSQAMPPPKLQPTFAKQQPTKQIYEARQLRVISNQSKQNVNLPQQPRVRQPMVSQPLVSQPMVHKPMMHQSMVNQLHKPMVHQPTTPPMANQPKISQPSLNQPMVHKAMMHQPMLNQPKMYQPLVNQSMVHQHMQHMVHKPILNQTREHHPSYQTQKQVAEKHDRPTLTYVSPEVQRILQQNKKATYQTRHTPYIPPLNKFNEFSQASRKQDILAFQVTSNFQSRPKLQPYQATSFPLKFQKTNWQNNHAEGKDISSGIVRNPTMPQPFHATALPSLPTLNIHPPQFQLNIPLRQSITQSTQVMNVTTKTPTPVQPYPQPESMQFCFEEDSAREQQQPDNRLSFDGSIDFQDYSSLEGALKKVQSKARVYCLQEQNMPRLANLSKIPRPAVDKCLARDSPDSSSFLHSPVDECQTIEVDLQEEAREEEVEAEDQNLLESIQNRMRQSRDSGFSSFCRMSRAAFVVERHQDGSRYEGWKVRGQRHGLGKFYYEDGGFYSGEWVQDAMCGKGILYYKNGMPAYDGYWKDDKFHGEGVLFNEHPTESSEPFDYSNFNEVGDLWVRFEGRFVEDSKEGRGVLLLSNGEILEGEFREDNINGTGEFRSRGGKVVHGCWQDNVLVEQFVV